MPKNYDTVITVLKITTAVLSLNFVKRRKLQDVELKLHNSGSCNSRQSKPDDN